MLLVGCKSKQDPSANINILEAAFQKTPDEVRGDTLIKAYVAAANQQSVQHDSAANYLAKAAAVAEQIKRYGIATNYLTTAVKEHYGAVSTPKNISELARLYETQFKNMPGATALRKGLITAFPQSEFSSAAKEKLGTDTTKLSKDIEILGKAMFNSKTNQLDQIKSLLFMNYCDIYAMTQPSDTLSPDYILKSAETARYLKAYPKVIESYDWVLAKFPNYKGVSKALFLKGFTYDNDMKDTTNARKYYTEFLSKYPSDNFADDVKMLLNNLGKSEEEIIKAMQTQQAKK